MHEAFTVGKAYLIRTVTYFHVGRVTEAAKGYVRLDDASWVADTGRFSKALKDGVFSEVEPFTNPVFVNTASIIDATEWPHHLPREAK